MKMSDAGLKMLKELEGSVKHIYRDSAGLDTIGVGHLLTEDEKKTNKFKDGLTDEQIIDLLREDVKHAENAVASLVKVNLNQNQIDTLISFTFNVGRGALASSSLLRKLNAGDHDAVPVELMKWNKLRNPKTRKLEASKGLTKRREREATCWVMI